MDQLTPDEHRASKIVEAALLRVEHRYPGRPKDWPAGAWDGEPDVVEWFHEGFACMAIRHSTLGHWCGYVGVQSGHSWYQQGYDDVSADVHGGLTFAGDDLTPPQGVESYVAKLLRWWVGFDCGHSGDLAPAMLLARRTIGLGSSGDVYRALPYVVAEVERLVQQAKEVAQP